MLEVSEGEYTPLPLPPRMLSSNPLPLPEPLLVALALLDGVCVAEGEPLTGLLLIPEMLAEIAE